MKNNHEQAVSARDDSVRNGSALIVAMGVLILLAVLAITFIQMSGLGQQAVDAHMYQTRARMLAQSGIEEALARDLTDQRSIYYGEDWNASGEMSASGIGNKDQHGNLNGQLDTNLHPRYALRPSFFQEDPSETTDEGDALPLTIPVRDPAVGDPDEMHQRSFTGQLPPSSDGFDTYSLAVRDTSAMLNINSLNDNLSNIIDNLAENLEIDQVGETIVQNRPTSVSYDEDTREISGGYSSVGELEDVLDDETFEEISPYLTVSDHTWVDQSTVEPQPQDLENGDTPARPKDADQRVFANTNRVVGGEAPTKYDFGYDLQPRAPINVNRADEDLIAALITDLEAKARVISTPRGGDASSGYSPLYSYEQIGPIDEEDAADIAEEIVDYREAQQESSTTIDFRGNPEHDGPFSNWEEFEAFVDQVITGDGGESLGLDEEIGALLKVHFNPDTRFAKFNENAAAHISITREDGEQVFLDKTDFQYHTMEFTFYTAGRYEVTSHGRITDEEGRIVAESTVRGIINAYSMNRHTSQQDFIATGERSNTETYPENDNIFSDRTLEEAGGEVGSELAGLISIAPTETASRNRGGHSFNLSRDPEALDGAGGSNLPGSPMTVSAMADPNDTTTGGLLPDPEDSDDGSGPISEPGRGQVAYTDSVPDGLLITSDRYRLIPFGTNPSDGIDTWNQGHAEFWWKPRLALGDPETPNNPRSNYTPYRISLFNMWMMQEGGGIPLWTPTITSFSIDRNTNPPTYGSISTSDLGSWVNYWKTTFPPQSLNFNYPSELPAGFNVRLDYVSIPARDRRSTIYTEDFNGYHMWTRFQSTFDENTFTLGNLNHSINPTQYGSIGSFWDHAVEYGFGGDADWWGYASAGYKQWSIHSNSGVQSTLPLSTNDRIVPKPGQWMKITMKWEIEEHFSNTHEYWLSVQHAIEPKAGGYRWKHTGNMILTGKFWVNDVPSGRQQVLWDNAFDENELQFRPNDAWFESAGSGVPSTSQPSPHPPYPASDLAEVGNIGTLGGRLEESHISDQHDFVYYDSFAEGTIDQASITTNPGNAQRGTGNRYVTGDVEFVGTMSRRESENSPISEIDQKVFNAETDATVEIMGIAHTQYRPEFYMYESRELQERERPMWQVFLSTSQREGAVATPPDPSEEGDMEDPYGDSYDRWLGDRYTPAQLLGLSSPLVNEETGNIHLDPGESFEYRLVPDDASFTQPMYMTPFFSEITVQYAVQGAGNRLDNIYYTP